MCVIERDDKKTVGETLKQLRVNNKHHCCHQMETKLRMKRYIVMSLVFFADQKFNEHEFVIIFCVCVCPKFANETRNNKNEPKNICIHIVISLIAPKTQ